MRSVLAGGVFLEPGHPDALELRRRHRCPNPDRKRLEDLARRRGWKRTRLPPPWVDAGAELPEPHPWAGGIALPRHGDLGDLESQDFRVLPPAPTETLKLELRPYQAQAFQAWRDRGEGLIQAPCGSGKTAIGLAAIALSPTPALVLVHTKDLLEQWVARTHSALGLRAEVCRDGSGPRQGRLVVATVQTVSTWPFWERHAWGKGFGFVVVDEAHHTPADTFTQVLLTLPGRLRLGLTATPERPDGLTPFMRWHLGPTAAAIAQEDLVGAGVVLAPIVRFVPTACSVGQREEWGEMVSRLLGDEGRTALIVREAAELVRAGRQVLVLTERVAHAEQLAEGLRATGCVAEALHGELTPTIRRQRLAEAASGQLRAIVATQLADEGLDLPALSGLVLTCPQRGHGRLRQRIGRVSRTCAGKRDAVVIDLVDGGWLERLWRSRARVYRELGCRVGTP